MDLSGGMNTLLVGLRAVQRKIGSGKGVMGLEINFPASEVPPVAIVGEDGADAVFVLDEIEEDGDDGFLFAGSEMLEEAGADDIDTGELEGGGRIGAEPVVNIGDLAGRGIPGDVEGVTGAAQDERHRIAALAMIIDGGLEGDIREDIAIVDEEWFVADEVSDVGNPAGGFKEDGFEAKGDRSLAIGMAGKRVVVFLGAMVGIDDEIANPGVEEMIEGVADERLLKDRDERLGEGLGERPEPRAETGP